TEPTQCLLEIVRFFEAAKPACGRLEGVRHLPGMASAHLGVEIVDALLDGSLGLDRVEQLDEPSDVAADILSSDEIGNRENSLSNRFLDRILQERVAVKPVVDGRGIRVMGVHPNRLPAPLLRGPLLLPRVRASGRWPSPRRSGCGT